MTRAGNTTLDVLGAFDEQLIETLTKTTEAEALRYNCWPAPEFANPAVVVVGNLGLSKEQELAIVAYVRTLADTVTPRKP